MCSTPKPKRKIKGKKGNASVGILSSMSSEKRQSFAQRANQASDRRIEAQQLKRAKFDRINKLKVINSLPQNTITKSPQFNNQVKHQNQSGIYWLLSASIGDIFRRFVIGK